MFFAEPSFEVREWNPLSRIELCERIFNRLHDAGLVVDAHCPPKNVDAHQDVRISSDEPSTLV
jgi:hypothetical protein